MNPRIYNRVLAVLRTLRSDNDLKPSRQEVLKTELLQSISHYEASLSHAQTTFWQKFFAAKPLPVALTFVIAILIAGGGAFATASSLPGDPLHPVKLAAEQIELRLAGSLETKAQLQAKHTSERLYELAELETRVEITSDSGRKTEIEKEHVSATTAVQSELETTFNTLNEVQTRFESDGNTEAAAHMKDVRERLTNRAVNSRFKVRLEDDHGTIKIKVENEDRDKKKEEDRTKDDRPTIQLQTDIQPKLKLRIDQKQEDSLDDEDRSREDSAN